MIDPLDLCEEHYTYSYLEKQPSSRLPNENSAELEVIDALKKKASTDLITQLLEKVSTFKYQKVIFQLLISHYKDPSFIKTVYTKINNHSPFLFSKELVEEALSNKRDYITIKTLIENAARDSLSKTTILEAITHQPDKRIIRLIFNNSPTIQFGKHSLCKIISLLNEHEIKKNITIHRPPHKQLNKILPLVLKNCKETIRYEKLLTISIEESMHPFIIRVLLNRAPKFVITARLMHKVIMHKFAKLLIDMFQENNLKLPIDEEILQTVLSQQPSNIALCSTLIQHTSCIDKNNFISAFHFNSQPCIIEELIEKVEKLYVTTITHHTRCDNLQIVTQAIASNVSPRALEILLKKLNPLKISVFFLMYILTIPHVCQSGIMNILLKYQSEIDQLASLDLNKLLRLLIIENADESIITVLIEEHMPNFSTTTELMEHALRQTPCSRQVLNILTQYLAPDALNINILHQILSIPQNEELLLNTLKQATSFQITPEIIEFAKTKKCSDFSVALLEKRIIKN